MKNLKPVISLIVLALLSACEPDGPGAWDPYAPPFPPAPSDPVLPPHPDRVKLKANKQLVLGDASATCEAMNASLNASNRYNHQDAIVYVIKRFDCPPPLQSVAVVLTEQSATATFTIPNAGGFFTLNKRTAITVLQDSLY